MCVVQKVVTVMYLNLRNPEKLIQIISEFEEIEDFLTELVERVFKPYKTPNDVLLVQSGLIGIIEKLEAELNEQELLEAEKRG